MLAATQMRPLEVTTLPFSLNDVQAMQSWWKIAVEMVEL